MEPTLKKKHTCYYFTILLQEPNWVLQKDFLLVSDFFCRRRMRKSPDDCAGHEFYPCLNFSEFLEEARQYAREVKPEESYRNSEVREEKRIKKSWSSSLMSWLKGEKKSSKHNNIATTNPDISKPKKSYASGPICGNAKRIDTMRSHRPVSGPPSTILFSPTRRGETEVPYMCLDQPQNSQHSNAYGPLYLVT